ncbi:MAG: peptide deformylase [Acidimicrobiia bacterium]|nr:peptide deformylase [Acidimicrobiia bacterium]MCL4293961.1 peptide deformylase [Acidimicrobiia bacterium]
MPPLSIRLFGDPVLKQRAREVEELNGSLAGLVETMYETMYDAVGVGLAAPQVGVGRRLFTYDLGDGDGPRVVVNPVIVESSGESVFDEGCLSVPGLSLEIVRPQRVVVQGVDLDGKEVVFDDDDYLARVFQHELDHLDGVLMIDRVEGDARKQALRQLRERDLEAEARAARQNRSGDARL